MPKINSSGIVSIPIIIALVILIAFTGYAATKSFIGNKSLSPSPSPIFTPTPSPSPSPSPSPTPTPTPRPSVAATSATSPTPSPSKAPASGGSTGGNIQTEVGSFRASVVTLPIGVTMFTDTSTDTDCAADCPVKPLADYINGNGGFAGIHGTYTCPADYAECASKKNSFDFPVYNSRVGRWLNEDKFGYSGRSMIYQDAGGGYHYQQNAGRVDGIRGGIVNYPGILNDGHITVEPSSLSQKQSSKGTKGGIGFNDNSIFLVVAYNVDMHDFANVFKALGAKYALNLDGGGSVALYQGGYKAGPGRALPNAIVFK